MPAPEFSVEGLPNLSDSTPISYGSTINQLKVSNIGLTPRYSSFKIIIKGIRNPSQGTTSSGWAVDIDYNAR